MKKSLLAFAATAFAATLAAPPTGATTFPTLTLIYVAAGGTDNDANTNARVATLVTCTNRSNQTASVRFQFRRVDGVPLAGGTFLVANLATKTVTTHGGTALHQETVIPTGLFFDGSLEVLSTQSAIYCTAMLVDAADAESPRGVALHMVRFNPHPGTVE